MTLMSISIECHIRISSRSRISRIDGGGRGRWFFFLCFCGGGCLDHVRSIVVIGRLKVG